jgi:hypothetical protein
VEVVDTSTGRITARLRDPGGRAEARAVGSKVLVTYKDSLTNQPTSQLLWDPATGATTALPGTGYLVGQRRSPGWLWHSAGSGCYERVSISAPTAPGSQACDGADAPSVQPLLSFDGSTAIVVRAGRLVAVEVDSGRVLSSGSLGPILGDASKREVHGAQWESTTTYIAHAKWDGQLALVRCRSTDGRCERVVRSSARPSSWDIAVGW